MSERINLDALLPDSIECELDGKIFLIPPLSLQRQREALRLQTAIGPEPTEQDLDRLLAMTSSLTCDPADRSKPGLTVEELGATSLPVLQRIVELAMGTVGENHNRPPVSTRARSSSASSGGSTRARRKAS